MTLALVLADIAESIAAPAQQSFEQAQQRLDSLTKPLGSLGQLERIAARMVAIRSGAVDLPLRKAAYVFAADHGVTEEGVSAYPRDVTAQMVLNFLRGGAAINVLARLHQVDLAVVDVGVDAEFAEHDGLVRAKVRRASRNLLREPAMSEGELTAALRVGLQMADRASEAGYHLLAVGEMGIGNTTAASAITAMLTGQPVEEVTGCGAGLDDEGKDRKLDVLRRALQLHFPDACSTTSVPVEILHRVGGLEIAAMTGFFLGAACHRLAILCDGFISTAAAAAAVAIAPQTRNYLFAGHCSQEPGHRHLLRFMELRPILNLEMRLGEGTGAVLAMPIIESALRLYSEMATFASAGVSRPKA